MLFDLRDQLNMDMDTQVDQLGDDCEGTVRLWMYLGWVAAFFITVPLQWLFVSIYSAYYDELKDDEVDRASYAPLAN